MSAGRRFLRAAAVLAVAAGPAAAQAGAPGPDGSTPRVDDQAFDCLMDAAERVKLNAEVPGFLRAIYVHRGDRVVSGQVVAELSSGLEQANATLARVHAENDATVAASRAKLDLAKRRLARVTTLRASNVGSEKDNDEAIADAQVAEQTLQDALANRKAAQAELARAEVQLAQRQIRSPISGIVVERNLAPGEYVHDQVHVLSLANIDELHVEVFVPVSYYGQIIPGARAAVMPEAPVGGRYDAAVTIVDPLIDATSGTFGVRLTLPNADWRLPAGLRCRVHFSPPAAGTGARAG